MLLYYNMFIKHDRCMNDFLNWKFLLSGARLRQPSATTEIKKPSLIHSSTSLLKSAQQHHHNKLYYIMCFYYTLNADSPI